MGEGREDGKGEWERKRRRGDERRGKWKTEGREERGTRRESRGDRRGERGGRIVERVPTDG